MTNKPTLLRLAVLCSAVLMLMGCESVNNSVKDTMGSVKQNLSNLSMPSFGFTQQDEDNGEPSDQKAQTVDCPPVIAVDDLRFLHQYMDGNDIKPVNRISSIVITRTESQCHVQNGTLVVDLTIEFHGTLGPEAETWKTRQVSFAYPYFLAIGTPEDTIMAKEIFPLTLSYRSDEKEVFHRENIRQVIPFSGDYGATAYKILLGFQLTENELRYNQTLLRRDTGKKPVISDSTQDPEIARPASKTVLEAPPLPLNKPPYEIKGDHDTDKVKAAPPPSVKDPEIIMESDAMPETDTPPAAPAEAMSVEDEQMPSKQNQTSTGTDTNVTTMAPSKPVHSTAERQMTSGDSSRPGGTPATDGSGSDIPPLDFYEYPEDQSPQPPEMPTMSE